VVEDRVEIISLIEEAQSTGAKQSEACKIIGISAKTVQRWQNQGNAQDGRIDVQHSPKNKLSELECRRVLQVANEVKYAHLPPCKIVPTLADEGRYIASESTFYRLLKAQDQLKHRQKSKPARKIKKPRALTATAPNQVYTWDISYLPTHIRGLYFYLYLVVDLYSRKVVGWQVYTEESSALAAELMKDICRRENITPNQVYLHSDNGSPMKGATMLSTLQELGVIPSFSRPSVSNDNPYSESLFRTLKYRPEYPEKGFEVLEAARTWMNDFVRWYNCVHLHSSIKFVTPEDRHIGKDSDVLESRKSVYLKAQAENPERWSGKIRNWDHIKEVFLNPSKQKPGIEKDDKAA
jgi:transposase InsO family protein